ncbi:Hypothetical_protein [Hexamita inflata]|uniref:Hypothetical_protein n=1 Tax=Hexamita inflata TaxID=28002 RepID=A0AA86R9L9_9EUKA|nr:Hypothetical protein HINF_LOCUS51790 [Hexamita inflata]
MMPAQHFESGDFTFRNRFGRAASQEVICGKEREAQPNESIIDHTKQSWYSSNASSALTLSYQNIIFRQCYNLEQHEAKTKLYKYNLLLSQQIQLGTASSMKLLQVIENFVSNIRVPPKHFIFQNSNNNVMLQYASTSTMNAITFGQFQCCKIQ